MDATVFSLTPVPATSLSQVETAGSAFITVETFVVKAVVLQCIKMEKASHCG